jgi:kinesin family protein 1
MQLRLSSFTGGAAIESEEVFPSNAVDLDHTVSSDLRFRRMFNIAMTQKISRHLHEGYAPVEFFAMVKPQYIERLERWDDLREQTAPTLPKPSETSKEPDEDLLSGMRRSETDFVAQETHDVVAWVQFTELASDGEYHSVPVTSQNSLDPGLFALHQGLQRRLLLTLTSNSGHQLPWTLIPRVRLGNVRLLDAKGRIHETASKELVDLKLLKQHPAEYNPDGTSTLGVEAIWDSGVHDSYILNRVTAGNHRVLLQVSWAADVDTCQDPATFSMDVAVTIEARDAKPPSKLLTLLSSVKHLNKTSTVFSVRLTPPITRSIKDLWRMDTSEKYVRGEEALGRWKARGISVVTDYLSLDSSQRRAADLNAIKTVLSAITMGSPNPSRSVRDPEALMRKALTAWPKGPHQSAHVRLLASRYIYSY